MEEDKIREELDQETTHNDPVDPPTSSGGTITGGHIRFAKLGLTPFTSSKQYMMACLDTIFFYKAKKTIIS